MHPQSTDQSVYRLLGGPGSPYSLKMRAVLRYRRIPHLWIVPRGYLGSEGELQRAGKGIIPVLQYPDGAYHADSTPLIHDLEKRHPGQRSVIPSDPAAAFLSHLIEDLGDELLVAAMFDLRWTSVADQTFCATRQLSGWLGPTPRASLDALVERFTQRQTRNRQAMVGDEGGPEILSAFYKAMLEVMESMQERTAYLFGDRPSLADFGLYGQLSQCAIDPSASAILRQYAPRTFQWTQSLDDACGVEGEWASQQTWEPSVRQMLALAGHYLLPFLRAHYEAVEGEADTFEVVIDGLRWRGKPDRYKHKCLVWLQRAWAELAPQAQEAIRELLEETGCLGYLTPLTEPRRPVAAMAVR